MAKSSSEHWNRLLLRREARLRRKARTGSHPISHIEPLKAYDWMLAECASANAQRQARQDGLVATVIQISSAALLAVPGFLFAADVKIPSFIENPLLHGGIWAFGAAFITAMAEQYFSGIAYERHVSVLHKYYTFQSDKTEDKSSRHRVKIARRACYALFTAAMTMSTIGLFRIGE